MHSTVWQHPPILRRQVLPVLPAQTHTRRSQDTGPAPHQHQHQGILGNPPPEPTRGPFPRQGYPV